MWTRLRLRCAALVRRTRFERELADELAFHVQSRAEEWERRGLSPSAARRRALIELGSAERIKEEVRDVRLGRWLEVLRQDLRYGFRVLRAHPGITAIGVVSLAFGMAVCIYSFSRVHADYLAPLPGAREPGSLVAVDARLSYPAFERIRELDDIIEGATAYLGPVPFSVAVDGEQGAERLHVLWLVLREATFLVITGAVLGTAGAFALSRALSALDPGLAQVLGAYVGDPVLLVGAPVLLVAAALLACAVPAWRAVRIDPASTLRAE